ncbi:MAG: ABC transporter substrate-binding protein [Acidimicrobiales bacterium]
MRKNQIGRFAGVVLGGAALLSACSSSTPTSSPPKATNATTTAAHSTLTISAADGETWPCGFSPFNPNLYFFSLGLVNEELVYINSLTGKMTPWLATSYQWSNGDKTLAWTIRKGVKFSNGDPLTAADVVFTFNLIKSHPALDLNSIDPVLSSVRQTGKYTLVMNFKTPAVTDFYYIADLVPIVPATVWSKVKNPVTYLDPKPIGTGPYTIQSCTPQNISYVKNPHYWQPGLPKIDHVEVPAIITNTVANEELANGTAQWGGQFIPDIKAYYLAKNKNYRTWSPSGGINGIYINLTNPILSNVAIRQAMAYAINRNRVAQIGEYGEEAPGNQSGVLLPMERAWYNSSLAAKYNYRYDPAKAISILKAAGFKRGAGGVFQTPSGKPLDFTIINVGGYSDWVSDIQIVASELAKVGINVTPVNLSNSTYASQLDDGHFQLAMGGPPGVTIDGPYGMLRGLLYSPNSAPIGKPASSDFERFSSPAEDALFNKLVSTTAPSQQEKIMKQIEVPMLTDVPFIPLTDSAAWNEYNVAVASGWPTASNPYANPSPTTQPDEEIVLLHLVPKG